MKNAPRPANAAEIGAFTFTTPYNLTANFQVLIAQNNNIAYVYVKIFDRTIVRGIKRI